MSSFTKLVPTWSIGSQLFRLKSVMFPAKKRDVISRDIVAEWVGEPRDPKLQGTATKKSEIVWRTVYLRQAILDIRQVLVLAKAIPIKSIGLSRSEQLKFVWWAYLSRVSEYQDRLFKFHLAARGISAAGSKDKFFGSKKQFAVKFLAPLKPLVSLRNHWVHDSEPEFTELKRLSSLELFAMAYQTDDNSEALVKLLTKEAQRVSKTEKKRLISLLENNDSAFEKIADLVVSYSSKHADLRTSSTE